MTFREQVAAMFFVAPPFEGVKYGAKDSIEEAQILADACCRQWGHDVVAGVAAHQDGSPGAETHREYCRRCGIDPTKPTKETP